MNMIIISNDDNNNRILTLSDWLTFAPLLINSWTVSTLPLSDAPCNGDHPS